MKVLRFVCIFLLIFAASYLIRDTLPAISGAIMSGDPEISDVEFRMKGLQSAIQDFFTPEKKILAIGGRLTKFNLGLAPSEVYAIAAAVEKYSNQQELDPYLIMAVIIVESSGRINAVSPKGAIGLMQVMPHMAEELGFNGDLFDIDNNIRLGAFILADNIRRWGYHEGIQRYFWGTGALDNRYLTRVLKVIDEIKEGGLTG